MLAAFALTVGVNAQTGSADAPETDYRLAMITHSGDGASFVVIETPDGQQALMKVGSELGPLRIVAINEETVDVHIDGAPHTLHSDYGRFDADAYAQFDAVPIEQRERGEITTLEVDTEEMNRAITQLAAQPEITTMDINSVFGLMESATIVSVNQHPVDSSRKAIEALKQGVKDGRVYKIETLDPDSGEHREIYIAEKTEDPTST
jgi:hypothetical protein